MENEPTLLAGRVERKRTNGHSQNPVQVLALEQGLAAYEQNVQQMIHDAAAQGILSRLQIVEAETARSELRAAPIMLAGVGRSGTTWAADVINCNRGLRVMFEPFHPHLKEAESFSEVRYLRPGEDDPRRKEQAASILAGNVHHPWVNKEGRYNGTERLVIKAIRCNLMLKWLTEIRPEMPIVLMMRHPLSVVSSRLKTGMRYDGPILDNCFQIMASQQALLEDYPVVGQAMEEIDPTDAFERAVLVWSVFHHVPFKQFAEGELYVLSYENLLLDPQAETRRLFAYLGLDYDWERVRGALQRPSKTNLLKRDVQADRHKLLTGWRGAFSEEQVQRANHILSLFGLDRLYDPEGYPQADRVLQAS